MIFQDQIKLAISSSNLDEFTFKDCIVGGDECILVNPNHIGAHWNKNNLALRSCIYRKRDYYPISLGYCKFHNYQECPDAYPDPLNYKDWFINLKYDGSLIIASYYNNQLVIRTRGTSNIDMHDTAKEVYELIDKTDIVGQDWLLNGQFTFLMEHVTPNNQIILRYDKPELVFLDIIDNQSYKLLSPIISDNFAMTLGLRRPEVYKFDSVDEIIKNCEILKDKEGFVLNYNNHQNKVKIKTPFYLSLHRLKSELSSIDKVIDLWINLNYPDYQNFYNQLLSQFDFELVSQVKDHIIKITEAAKKANLILDSLRNFVQTLSGKSRKEQALAIQEKFGKSSVETTIAFILLNNKEITSKMMKELVYKQLNS